MHVNPIINLHVFFNGTKPQVTFTPPHPQFLLGNILHNVPGWNRLGAPGNPGQVSGYAHQVTFGCPGLLGTRKDADYYILVRQIIKFRWKGIILLPFTIILILSKFYFQSPYFFSGDENGQPAGNRTCQNKNDGGNPVKKIPPHPQFGDYIPPFRQTINP